MGDPSDTPADASMSKLFQPIKVGEVTLGHRVVYAPCTRLRADTRGVHGDLAVTHYAQRASVPGTLLISEATCVSPASEGRGPNAPAVWSEEQVAGWRRVADAVHAKGSFIFMQIWALGRAARLEYIRERDPDFAYVSSSDVPVSGREDIPRPLTVGEIKEYVAAFAQAARNAVVGAGFDGVEIHAAHGYLIDQFTQDTCNTRTDEYGGSVENRCRFALEIVDAVCEAVGASRTAIRLSPWSTYLDMRMSDPLSTFTYLVSRIADKHTNFAYLHVVDPGVSGITNVDIKAGETNDPLRKIWFPRPYISAGKYTRERALRVAEETGELIAFGRAYISNPDLPWRLLKNVPLAEWNPDTYYIAGDPRGYIDYPFAEGFGVDS